MAIILSMELRLSVMITLLNHSAIVEGLFTYISILFCGHQAGGSLLWKGFVSNIHSCINSRPGKAFQRRGSKNSLKLN